MTITGFLVSIGIGVSGFILGMAYCFDKSKNK